MWKLRTTLPGQCGYATIYTAFKIRCNVAHYLQPTRPTCDFAIDNINVHHNIIYPHNYNKRLIKYNMREKFESTNNIKSLYDIKYYYIYDDGLKRDLFYFLQSFRDASKILSFPE